MKIKNKEWIEEMSITEMMKELNIKVKKTHKENKELIGLVCFLRKQFDDAVIYRNGIVEEFDFEKPKMKRSFDIMMQVRHDREMARREKEEAARPFREDLVR